MNDVQQILIFQIPCPVLVKELECQKDIRTVNVGLYLLLGLLLILLFFIGTTWETKLKVLSIDTMTFLAISLIGK